MPPIRLLPHIESFSVHPVLVKNYINRHLLLDEFMSEPIGLGGHNFRLLAVNTCIASDKDV